MEGPNSTEDVSGNSKPVKRYLSGQDLTGSGASQAESLLSAPSSVAATSANEKQWVALDASESKDSSNRGSNSSSTDTTFGSSTGINSHIVKRASMLKRGLKTKAFSPRTVILTTSALMYSHTVKKGRGFIALNSISSMGFVDEIGIEVENQFVHIPTTIRDPHYSFEATAATRRGRSVTVGHLTNGRMVKPFNAPLKTTGFYVIEDGGILLHTFICEDRNTAIEWVELALHQIAELVHVANEQQTQMLASAFDTDAQLEPERERSYTVQGRIRHGSSFAGSGNLRSRSGTMPQMLPRCIEQPDQLVLEGTLFKQGVRSKRWSKRNFMLTMDSLTYTRDTFGKAAPGVISASEIQCAAFVGTYDMEAVGNNPTFEVHLEFEEGFEHQHPEKKMMVQARSVAEATRWVAAINQVVERTQSRAGFKNSTQRASSLLADKQSSNLLASKHFTQ